MRKFGRPDRNSLPSSWLAIGAALILAVVVALLAIYNVRREERHMTRVLVEKGAALIRALEAGSRTGLMGFMGPGIRLEHLLAETASQPDILYIAVTDKQGVVLAHSHSDYIGQPFADPEVFSALAPAQDIRYHTVKDEQGRPAFMVYRRFLPLAGRPAQGDMDAMRRHMHGRMQGNPSAQSPESSEQGFFCSPQALEQGGEIDFSRDDLYIFIGMDQQTLDDARAQDVRSSIMLAGLVLLAGLAGVAALYWLQRLRASRRQLADVSALSSEVVSNLPVGLVVTDREDAIVFLNGPAQSILGLDEEQVRGRRPEDALPAEVHAAHACTVDSTGVKGCDQEVVCRIHGRDVPLGVSQSRILTEDEDFVGRLFVLRDLSEVKRLEEEIRRKEKLAAIGSLASGVAHEIRNPLSSIRGFAVYFRDRCGDDQGAADAARIMVNEVDRLSRVVSELLEYARPSDISPRMCSVRDVVENAIKLVEREAREGDTRIVTQGLEDVPSVPCDPDRLAQALLNLLLNAIQAMAEGGMGNILTIRAMEESGHVLLQVVDQGPGIAPERLEAIFDPYHTTKARGVGLGLAIVRKIAQAHGGDIRVSNEEGRGAAFTLALPVAAPEEGPRGDGQAANPQSRGE